MGNGVSSTYNPADECPFLAKMQGRDGMDPPDQEFILGKDDKGCEFKVFGATSGAYLLWDESADELILAGVARLNLSNATVKAANTDGGLIKAGTSSSRVAEDTANMKFLAFYLDNGATSGDNRGMYLRLYLTGAGGGGEAARIFTTVEDVTGGTAHGAHISLNFGDTGKISGLGVAMRGTLHIPDQAMSGGGTYAALQAEIYSDGDDSDPAGMTQLALIRLVNAGTSNGKADVDDDAVLFDFDGFTAGADHLVGANNAGGGTLDFSNWKLLKIDIGGTLHYLVAAQTIADT